MIPEIEQHRREIEPLCREYDVQRLALFGSAATGGFWVDISDLDFLVEFRAPLAAGYADRYFGLLEGLQDIFKRPVILIHGYAEIDDRLVWDIVENKLPVLRREVDELFVCD